MFSATKHEARRRHRVQARDLWKIKFLHFQYNSQAGGIILDVGTANLDVGTANHALIFQVKTAAWAKQD